MTENEIREEIDTDDLLSYMSLDGRVRKGEIEIGVDSDPTMVETECRLSHRSITATVTYSRDPNSSPVLEHWEADCDAFLGDEFELAEGADYDTAVADLAAKIEKLAQALTDRVTEAARKSRDQLIAAEIEFWAGEFEAGHEDFAEPGSAWDPEGEDLVYRRPDLGVDFIARRDLDHVVTVTTRPAVTD